MDKERVLIVHNYYQIPGGEDTVVSNERKMLEDNGHDVFMYSRHNDEIKKKGIIGKLLLPFETIYSLRTTRDIKKIVKEKKIDIVHVHNTFPLISPSVYSASKISGAKVVQTIHNFRLLCPAATFARDNKICEDCVNKGLLNSVKHKCYRNSKIQTIISASMLKFNRIIGSYKKIDAYIALTEFNKEKLSSLIPKEKIFVKPNFCEKPNIPIVPIEKRKYFMFLGRLDKLKGINLLVEAWKDIKDEELVVVGTGPEEEYIKSFIKENNMTNVKLVGLKKKDEAMKLLSKAKAIIVPSQWYEPFGLVLIESLKLGTPIIANNIGSISEIINDKKFGVIKKINNKNDIRNLVYDFLSSYTKYSEIEFAFKDRYTSENNYRILKNIYQTLYW
ncbi:glycosyltransferase family 4 protein [Clostridium sp.]|uniref:glycosyltransferase family 4 protein n=1 Tax=Clostridium sp. TaxID=1506 RepID=UPI00290ABB16|nr:glycosyltransferase family 4 protein [Clostridium sp.]MDU3526244.1 glycosyltransferase family 4 protein [Clostridium sp.]MDU3548477.1 glycosyltransferase family 4 protein [Clostridium sp.]